MKPIFRVMHALLVLSLTLILFWSVHYALSLLWADPQLRTHHQFAENHGLNLPSTEEIAKSLNTMWLSNDHWHCRNVCLLSATLCRLQNCENVPGVKSWA
ncbi:hypothetical protein BS50DRAFT_185969 [Corynespora cassiicola Philippines]|uniref:Uncharacterized protein n=1 Tax=Corynespora cassiicola Philippines TaxID=1448308 RepID=A0A2T2P7S9_CORCC|nr:hypothetical protein BS50DRAFT_185969 [Corynespora cassiicola Philippines]